MANDVWLRPYMKQKVQQAEEELQQRRAAAKEQRAAEVSGKRCFCCFSHRTGFAGPNLWRKSGKDAQICRHSELFEQ